MIDKSTLRVCIRAAGLYWSWKGCESIFFGIMQSLGLLPHERVSATGWILVGILYSIFAVLCFRRTEAITDWLYDD